MLIDFDLLSYLIGFVILIGLMIVLKKKFKNTNMYILFFSIFYFYILNVLKYTIFPIAIGTPSVEAMKATTTISSSINLIPFQYQQLQQTLLNILLFIPFGFGLPYIKKVNLRSLIVFGLIFSLIIELIQLTISMVIGYAYRVIDINDILANTMGAVVGYLIFIVFSKVVISTLRNFNTSQSQLSPFLSYIYNVAKG
ncbi:VanZ family protein [Cytobacillus gottheilii]|uniref:VanZ family protein n=1 Tax=Cytobacillus gottheilii TaxID=859144 RepID=UPI0024956655|nr:VanZ family protein [Cytobacillus gottheilii]